MMLGKISNIDPPKSGNISYTLNFRGPSLQCSQMNTTKEIQVPINTTSGVTISKFSMGSTEKRVFSLKLWPGYENINFYPCVDNLWKNEIPRSLNTSVTILQQVETLECLPATGMYGVNISYINGQQNVDYSVIDKQLLEVSSGDMYAEHSNLGSFEEYMNILALIDSSLGHLVYEGGVEEVGFRVDPKVSSRLPNGTTIETCPVGRNALQGSARDSGTLKTSKTSPCLTAD
jgi:hypothetical protein